MPGSARGNAASRRGRRSSASGDREDGGCRLGWISLPPCRSLARPPRASSRERRRIVRRMYAIAILRYRKPLEEILAAVDEHRAYLRTLEGEGLLLASGPFDPRSGGALLLRLPDDDVHRTLDRIRDGDPFT